MALTPPVDFRSNMHPRSIYSLTHNPSTMHSLSDVAKRTDPNLAIADIAEVLTESNEILQDIPYVEGNLPTGHRVTIRTGLPKAYWKRMNQGVPSSTSDVAQIEETCGICQARSIVDKMVADLNGNSAAYRASEDRAFIESLNEMMVDALFYGDSRKTGDGFIGLSPRYNTTDVKKAQCAKNVIDCGGTGDHLTSVWLIGWGENSIFGFYPKGTPVGLQRKDNGEIRVLDDNGYPFEAYETVYTWSNGLVVKDWRFAVRLCNIDVDQLMSGTGIGAGDLTAPNSTNLILMLNQALAKFPTQTSARVSIYMNPDVHAALNVIATRSNTNVLSTNESLNMFGEHSSWQSFLGRPIRRVDRLRNNEKHVD